MVNCRYCDFQPILLRKDGQPRQDIQHQLQGHMARNHPREMRQWRRGSAAAMRQVGQKTRDIARGDPVVRETLDHETFLDPFPRRR